jgi:hypothetical protein
MKQVFVTAFRFVLAACVLLSLSSLACGQHGGGGGHGGGHGGHSGGGSHMYAGHPARSQKSGGITRYPRFSVARLFGRHRRRHFAEPYFFANGLLLGDYVNCGLWDWSCLGWEDGYWDTGDGTYALPSTGESSSSAAEASPTVTVLYLRNGYSVGVTEYYFENEKLHYLTTYGGQDEVPIDSVDLQRTANENASMGVSFVLQPRKVSPPPENH